MELPPHVNSHPQGSATQSSTYDHPGRYSQRDAVAATAAAALSQQSSSGLQHAPAATDARKRRAPGGTSSRGVANLTPEQLAKKRANDREAQRAIRERTRGTIEGLERRIRELESQQPFQELQRALQERDRALAECEELKRRLAQVAGIAGASSDGSPAQAQAQANLHELATVTAQQSPMPALNHAHVQVHYPTSHPSQSHPYEQTHLHPDLRSPFTGSGSSPGAQTNHSEPNHSPAPTGGSRHGRTWSGTREDPPTLQHSTSDLTAYHNHQHHRTTSTHDRASRVSSDRSPHHPNTSTFQPLPRWARLPKNGPEECPLDQLLDKFIADRRAHYEAGATRAEAIGPEYPLWESLQAPPGSPRPEGHPLSELMVDLIHKFPFRKDLPLQVGVIYVVYLYLRWIICPCESCYMRLPPFFRPDAEQVDITHASWKDYLPWPYMRRRLIEPVSAATAVKFEDFLVPYTTTLAVIWPYPTDQILQLRPSPSGHGAPVLEMSPVFESHLNDLRNWSVGPDFARAFPQLINDEVTVAEVPS